MEVKSSVTSVSDQGRRKYQEDRYICVRLSEISRYYGRLLAVMDGHRGSDVASYCKSRIEYFFSLDNPESSKEALKQLVADLNEGTRNSPCGSTFSAVCILESHDKASVAILGDSPVIVIDKNGRVHVSPCHNARTNLEERALAVERGGIYTGGYIYNHEMTHGLQMTRALGDREMGNVISRKPDVYTIEAPRWICVASDGLVELLDDVLNNDKNAAIDKIVEMAKGGANAHDLLEWAKKKVLIDNTTIVVWQHKRG